MIHDSVEMHNVAEVELREGFAGFVLPRYPQSIRKQMGRMGFIETGKSTGVEMRFVSDSEFVRVYLSTLDDDAWVHVFRGDLLHESRVVKPGAITCIQTSPPELLNQIKDDGKNFGAFAPNVWRFLFESATGVFHEVDVGCADIRPPDPSEKPPKRWLAYGSSITNADGLHGYAMIAARRLKLDVLNKGLSGSCHCEKFVADYIAGCGEWDVISLELGINMMWAFDPPTFRERATYLVDKVLETADGAKPVFLITAFPASVDFRSEPDQGTRHLSAYRDILREIAAERSAPNVHLVEGSDVLTDISALKADLVHPTHRGHALMGENLAHIMAEYC